MDILPLPLLGHRRQGVHSDAPGPGDVRDDDRHSVDPTHPLRLCHQCGPEALADGGSSRRLRSSRTNTSPGDTEQRLLRIHPAGDERARSRRGTRSGRRAVRDQHSVQLFP